MSWIVSANIRFDTPEDGVHAWKHRREFLAKLLTEKKPAIIATQEGRKTQLKDLASLLPAYELVEQNREWIEERMYPCLFLRKDFFEYHDSGDRWLSETPQIAGSVSFQSTFPRLMTWIRISSKTANPHYYFIVNTHIDHISGTTRIPQSSVLIQQIQEIMKPADKLILIGDFNEGPSEEVRPHLMREFPQLYDPWIQKKLPEETSFHNFHPGITTGKRIDWILLDQSIEAHEIFLDKRKENGIFPTDHYPLLCRITF